MTRYGRLAFRSLAVTLVALAGCDGLLNIFNPNDAGETGKAALKKFSSEREFTEYFAQQMQQRNDQVTDLDRAVLEVGSENDGATNGEAPQADASTGGGDADAADDGFSGTTVQEQGVDESDVVKTDGNYLYLIGSDGDGSVLRIVDVRSRTAMRETGAVELKGWGNELYLHGSTVVAITSSGGGIFYLDAGFGGAEGTVDVKPASDPDVAVSSGNAGSETDAGDADADVDPAGDDVVSIDPIFAPGAYRYERPRTLVTVIDVSNPAAPSVQSSTAFDGSQASSRMIDGVLHLVLANYQDYYIDVLPMLGRPQFESTDVQPETVIPKYTRTDANGAETSGDVLSWGDFYRPVDPDGFGTVYVVSLDADADAAFSAVGVVAEPGMIYSSREALYLTDTNYDWQGNQRTTTDVYKLQYDGRGARPVAAGSLSGRVLNQYSMGEHQGYLRAATTIDPTWDFTGQTSESSNNVFVLSQDGDALNIVGRIENIAPGESIQSARFMGNRGYLVTFEQIDPLFTIDLADPVAPRIVGELKVPGFSTFIVPIDENNVLTVGQYIPETNDVFRPWAVQLTIFDVSDFANPTQKFNTVIGADTGAYSEALWNPKAFTYYADRGLIALPVSIYGDIFVRPVDEEPVAIDGDVAVDGGGSSGSADAAPPETTEGGTEPSGDSSFVPEGFDGLAVFSVSAESGFAELGRLSTRFVKDGFYYWPGYTRGVFLGTDVLAVTDQGLRGSPTSNVTASAFELMFAPSNGGIEDVPTIDVGEVVGSDPAETPAEPSAEPESGTIAGG